MKNDIKAIRKSKGLTQNELGKLTNIGRVNITRYESGKHDPTIENALKIANCLESTLDELFAKPNKANKEETK